MSNLTDFTGGGVKSIQRGIIAGSATITIDAVDVNKTTTGGGFRSTGSQTISTFNTSNSNAHGYAVSYGKSGSYVNLIDATTIEVVATDTNTTTVWEVIEYA